MHKPLTTAHDSQMQRLHDERILILNVAPQIDSGRYPIKRIVGDLVHVEATLLREGHDHLAAVLKSMRVEETEWTLTPMTQRADGRWIASFRVEELKDYVYTIEAWTDRFGTWRWGLERKYEAGIHDLRSELLEGAHLVDEARLQAVEWAGDQDSSEHTANALFLKHCAEQLRHLPAGAAVALARDLQLEACMLRYAERRNLTTLDRLIYVTVDRPKARCGAWYELFVRSQTDDPRRHGTFRDCIKRLPEIARLGFDVLYLTPIHPIGTTHRKGRNNTLKAGPHDPGSPWAIGSEEGGHDAVHPELGTLKDFRDLVQAARELGIEIALDIAMQCSPDHPYLKKHPQWFKHRPDGTLQYAENPPKKYQDIYPLDFDTEDWVSLWQEWKRIFLFWIKQGVSIFRVDNPHTKPFGFWEWLIHEIRLVHPEAIFLSEAFTIPDKMKTLAKLGFTQSYTYFTWTNDKPGLIQYFTDLTRSEMVEYFRGNLFANTPDILHAYLQKGGRPAFKIRLLLAATLSSSYGIYSGYELCENVPVEPGSEEYLHSEKYEIKVRDWNHVLNINDFIQRVNRARRDNPALHFYDNLRFHACEHPDVMVYSKAAPDGQNVVLVIVSLNPRDAVSCHVDLDLSLLGLTDQHVFEVEDQITGARWTWRGARQFIILHPDKEPGHLLVLRKASLES